MSTQQEEQQRRGPLAGIKVLDFSRILSGPYASMVLADLGAEVVKVEPIGSGDETRNFPPFKGPLSHYFIALNRSKKSITLDLAIYLMHVWPVSGHRPFSAFWFCMLLLPRYSPLRRHQENENAHRW